MSLNLALRSGQTNPLSWAQVDANWTALQNFCNALGQSGTTTQRTAYTPLFIGQPWMDTTLGFQVNCLTLSPATWVDAAGVLV